jgi:serine/threonine-protein kinase
MTNQEPTTVGGRYELAELLGRGGMAEVRKGVDTRLGRTVAVKRLRTDLASDATFQARFRREAQSSASLNHPAIVAVYDTGEERAAGGPDGIAQPYIVMEYVAGRTLRDILREGRKILPERALEIACGVLSALDYSHRAGIIHRDIKPANVMLTPSGDVKVMDFGIARAISDAANTMTQTAAVVGTAQYLSPEQARGESVDSRSDVYSAGCLLYELLTGRPPFVGESPVAVAYQHVREPADPPSTHDSDIDPELDAIVMKSLTKRVEDRYQSAAAMRSDIERYLAGRPVQAPAVAAVPAATGYGGPTAVVNGYSAGNTSHAGAHTAVGIPVIQDEPERRRTGLWLLLSLLVIALVGALAFAVPKLIHQTPDPVAVPDVINLIQSAAASELKAADFKVEVVEQTNSTVPKGKVFGQDPPGGKLAPFGSTVTITVSSGKPSKVVPDVTDQSYTDAESTLVAAGFQVKQETRESDKDKDVVVDQFPVGGQTVFEGRQITLFVSDGPETIPDVRGLKEGAACKAIRDAGFRCDPVPFDSTDKPKGTVVDQLPGAQEAASGTKVTIYISTYVPPPPPPSPSPSVTPSPTASETPGGGLLGLGG